MPDLDKDFLVKDLKPGDSFLVKSDAGKDDYFIKDYIVQVKIIIALQPSFNKLYTDVYVLTNCIVNDPSEFSEILSFRSTTYLKDSIFLCSRKMLSVEQL